MSIIQIILIAFSLAMDAFTVAISNGMLLKNIKIKHALKFGACFGLFQFAMPIAGYYLADILKEQVEKFDYIIAFILLNAIGFNMLLSKDEDDEDYYNKDCKYNENNKEHILSFKNLTMLGIATSIDAFAVGASFYALKINIFTSSIIIGVVAFIMSFIGIYIGNKLGSIFSKYAEKIGGFILILIAFKIFFSH